MKVTFSLDTSADHFAVWLEHKTRMVPNRHFPTRKGRVTLQSGRAPYRITGPTRIDMDAIYSWPISEDTEQARPLGATLFLASSVRSSHAAE